MNDSIKETVLPEKLIAAYSDADYVVECDSYSFVMRIGSHSQEMDDILQQHAATTMAIISAFNPLSNPTDEMINIQNTEKLGNELRQRFISFKQGLSKSTHGEWPEKNFIVIDIDLDTAKEIGKHYKQNAIVFYEKGGVAKLILLQ